LKTSRDGDSTTSLGSLFQCFTTLLLKTFCLNLNLNQPKPPAAPLFPLLLPPVAWEMGLTPTALQPSLRSLYTVIRSPPSLLSSRLHNPSSLSTPHTTCSLGPSAAPFPFLGHAPGPPRPSCSEGPKTEQGIHGATSPELSTGGESGSQTTRCLLLYHICTILFDQPFFSPFSFFFFNYFFLHLS